MARTTPTRPTGWQVMSVSRRTRDGSERLAEVYRILLGQRRCRRDGAVDLRQGLSTEERSDGDGLVRSGVN